MSRTKANIDWKKVDEYLHAQCDGMGIAGILGIHYNTLYERCKKENNCDFSEYSARKKGEGKELLRKKQWDTAYKDGDRVMQIWLGKQYLDQVDKKEVKQEITGEGLKIVAPTTEAQEIIDRINQRNADNNATDPTDTE